MRRSRVAHLDLARGERALILGAGTGEFVADWLAAGYTGSLTLVDLSSGMLQCARRRLRRSGVESRAKIDFVQLDATKEIPGGPFDIVATHYFLDQFTGEALPQVMSAIDGLLVSGGCWLYTDFAPATGGPVRRRVQAGATRGLYEFFGVVCGLTARRLPPIGNQFRALGYEEVRRAEFCGGWIEAIAYRRP